MAANRSNILRAKVQRALGDPAGIGVAEAGMVYESLNNVMDEICEQASAKEVSGTVTLVASTELYNFPDGFISETGAPYGSDTTPMVKLNNMWEVSNLKRTGSVSSSQTTVPSYYYKLNRQIGFLSPSGSAPSAAGTITLWYTRKRLSDGTEDIGESVEPIVDSRWDRALMLGACWELSNDPKYLAMYEQEKQKQITLQNAQQDRTYKIPVVNEDYDG